MSKKIYFFLLITCLFTTSCISPPRVLDKVSGTPIPPGKTRITVQRSDQYFNAGGAPLRLIDLNSNQDNDDAIALCNLGKDSSIDVDKYAEAYIKNKKKLIWKKDVYDRIDAFSVIFSGNMQDIIAKNLKDSGKNTSPNLTTPSSPPHWATSNMGSGKTGKLYAVDQMQRPDSASLQEASSGLAALIVSGIETKMSEHEKFVDKIIFEKNVCQNFVVGKEITLLKLAEKVSWDRDPGRVDLFAALEGLFNDFAVAYGFFTDYNFSADTEYVIWVGVRQPKFIGDINVLDFKLLESLNLPEQLGIVND